MFCFGKNRVVGVLVYVVRVYYGVVVEGGIGFFLGVCLDYSEFGCVSSVNGMGLGLLG